MSEPLLIAKLRGEVGRLSIELELEARSGELILISGESGAGKTTALKMISLLIKPDRGILKFRDKVLFSDGVKALSKDVLHYRRCVPLVTQAPPIVDLTVWENLALPLPRGSSYEREKAADLLHRLGFSNPIEVMDKPALKLSAGESQRVSLVRALLLDPEGLLLDEPTANLDEGNKERVEELLLDLLRAGKFIIMVTHDLQVVEALRREHVSLRSYQMSEGKLSPSRASYT